jgi:hypothetical protein
MSAKQITKKKKQTHSLTKKKPSCVSMCIHFLHISKATYLSCCFCSLISYIQYQIKNFIFFCLSFTDNIPVAFHKFQILYIIIVVVVRPCHSSQATNLNRIKII